MPEVNIVSLTTAFPFTYSQSAQAESSLATQTCAYGSDVSEGDLLIVCVDVDQQTITGISDTQGNTWTAIPSAPIETDSGAPRFVAMYWTVAKSSSANTVTVAYNTSSAGASVILIAAYTPSGGTPVLDTSGTNSGTSVTSLTATTGSVTYPIDLLVAFCSSFGSNNTPCGYTVREDVGPGAATLLDAAASGDGVQSISETFVSSTAGLILAAFSSVASRKLSFTIS
jgi:hypothetical protein